MKRILPILLLGAGIGALALAQEASEAMLPAFADVDENEDGKIDAAEAELLTETLKESQSDLVFDFQTADANEDGAVDAAEYTKYQEDMHS